MNRKRVMISLVVTVIVATAVAFGPLIAGVSLADGSESDVAFGAGGSLTLVSVQFPETATIDSADYGAANAYLRVPPATVEFGSLTGNPTLVYMLRIEGLGLQRSTSHFLDSSYGPTYEATMSTGTIDKSDIDQQSYDATLSLNVRNGSGLRTAAQRNITIEVAK